MWKALIVGAILALLLDSAAAQNLGSPSSSADLANLGEQVRALADQVGQLSVRLERAEHDNASLRAEVDALKQSAVTVARLNAAVADLNHLVESDTQATREQIAEAIRKLGDQTNAALKALAKGQAAPPAPAPASGDPETKDVVIRYTVQPGDSLSSIAKKTGAKKQDIIDANKITNESKIYSGQTLLIPGGKAPAAPAAPPP